MRRGPASPLLAVLVTTALGFGFDAPTTDFDAPTTDFDARTTDFDAPTTDFECSLAIKLDAAGCCAAFSISMAAPLWSFRLSERVSGIYYYVKTKVLVR